MLKMGMSHSFRKLLEVFSALKHYQKAKAVTNDDMDERTSEHLKMQWLEQNCDALEEYNQRSEECGIFSDSLA